MFFCFRRIDQFSFMHAQHVLSYHLLQVPYIHLRPAYYTVYTYPYISSIHAYIRVGHKGCSQSRFDPNTPTTTQTPNKNTKPTKDTAAPKQRAAKNNDKECDTHNIKQNETKEHQQKQNNQSLLLIYAVNI